MRCNACTFVQTRTLLMASRGGARFLGVFVSPLRTFAHFYGLPFLNKHYFLVFSVGMTIALLTVELAHRFARGVEVIYETADCL
jgi:hypothetical protein